MSGRREAAGIHDFDEGPEVLNVEHRAFRWRHLMLLLRAQERQLRGPLPTETAMANLLVINSSAAREDSISRVLIEEALPRLMCEQWIKKNKGATKWTQLAANKIQEHKTASMAQAQQSPASGALLGELQVGVCKTTGS